MDELLAYHWKAANDASQSRESRMPSCRHCIVQVMAAERCGRLSASCRDFLLQKLSSLYGELRADACQPTSNRYLKSTLTMETVTKLPFVQAVLSPVTSSATVGCQIAAAAAAKDSSRAGCGRPLAASNWAGCVMTKMGCEQPPTIAEGGSAPRQIHSDPTVSGGISGWRLEQGDGFGNASASCRADGFGPAGVTLDRSVDAARRENIMPVARAGDGCTRTVGSGSRWQAYSAAAATSVSSWPVQEHSGSREITCLDSDTESRCQVPATAFRTAHEQLIMDNAKRQRLGRGDDSQQQVTLSAFGQSKKSLGTRRGQWKFNPPVTTNDYNTTPILGGGAAVDDKLAQGFLQRRAAGEACGNEAGGKPTEGSVPPALKHIDPKLVELVLSEIMDSGQPVGWSDISGLDFAKKTIKEIVVLPMLRPDIFTGLRGPPKGLLLFGPPGTGKTLIGKCVASQAKATFFSISASSLTSKWIGEGEKMVRALFAIARWRQPAVIFVDEIDSLLSQRSETEHESSRRIKTEFLVQMDGVGSSSEDRVLLIGATNRPQELDEAARRRFVKRLYIPLPEADARRQIVLNLLSSQLHDLTASDLDCVVRRTQGYSGADMANLCREAALGPVRDLPADASIETITLDQVRPISLQDFECALTQVRASVSDKDLAGYIEWNSRFGSWLAPAAP